MAYRSTAYDPLRQQTTGTGVIGPISTENAGGPNGPHGPDNDPNIVWNPETSSYENKDAYLREHGNGGADGNSPSAHGIAQAQPYNAAAEAVRVGAAADNPLYTSGPQIDQTQSGETRGLTMGGLGMLGARAGGAETPADILAKQQTAGAVQGVQSGANSIRGGAAARAAAARGAASTGAHVEAVGNQNAAALHAKGMADAAGQYFGAASNQYGEDVGAAAAQAKLDAAQRVANEQRSENYEDAKFGYQKEATDTALGRSAAEQQNTNASRNQTMAENQASTGRALTAGGTAASTAAGGLSAYSKATANDGNGGNNPDDYSGSDPREKQNIEPMFGKSDTDLAMKPPTKAPLTDKQARTKLDVSEGILAGMEAGLKNGVDPATQRSIDRPSPLMPQEAPRAKDRVKGRAQAYDASMFKQDPKAAALDAAMRAPESPREQSLRDQESPPGNIIRENPYAEHSLFGVAPAGYAHARAGHEGGMFGGSGGTPARQSYDLGSGYHGAPGLNDEQEEMARAHEYHSGPTSPNAPGTRDFFMGAHKRWNNRKDRDIAMSDPNAKKAAFMAGQQHAITNGLRATASELGTSELQQNVSAGHTRGGVHELEARPKIDPAIPADISPPLTVEERAKLPNVHEAPRKYPDAYENARSVTSRIGQRGDWLSRQHQLPLPTALEDVGHRLSQNPTSKDKARDAQNAELDATQRQIDAVHNVQAQSELRDLRSRMSQDGLTPSDPQTKVRVAPVKVDANKSIDDLFGTGSKTTPPKPAPKKDQPFDEWRSSHPLAAPVKRDPTGQEVDPYTTSSRETKRAIASEPMADANRSMAPSSYEYKPEYLPAEQKPGEVNVGPMADKMKANPVAATAIVNDPRTGMLAIDKTKGLKLVMGGLADLQRQVDDLAKRKRA